jgi:hypothetical protein
MRLLAVLLAVLATFAATATAEAKRLVRYDVGGGFAGISERLIVAGDGAARHSVDRGDERRFKLSAKQLRGLRRDLKNARFSTLRRSYRPKHVVNDGIGQFVAYKGRSVSVSTGARYPARLHRVLERLASLMRTRAAGAAATRGCPGGLTEELRGTSWRIHSIRATSLSCAAARRQIRRFFDKADVSRRCHRASRRRPPTRGCAVGSYHCWRGLAKYCARPGHDVSWRETRR